MITLLLLSSSSYKICLHETRKIVNQLKSNEFNRFDNAWLHIQSGCRKRLIYFMYCFFFFFRFQEIRNNFYIIWDSLLQRHTITTEYMCVMISSEWHFEALEKFFRSICSHRWVSMDFLGCTFGNVHTYVLSIPKNMGP